MSPFLPSTAYLRPSLANPRLQPWSRSFRARSSPTMTLDCSTINLPLRRQEPLPRHLRPRPRPRHHRRPPPPAATLSPRPSLVCPPSPFSVSNSRLSTIWPPVSSSCFSACRDSPSPPSSFSSFCGPSCSSSSSQGSSNLGKCDRTVAASTADILHHQRRRHPDRRRGRPNSAIWRRANRRRHPRCDLCFDNCHVCLRVSHPSGSHLRFSCRVCLSCVSGSAPVQARTFALLPS